MKLNIKSLANSAALIVAALFTLCTLAIVLFPDAAQRLGSVLFHVDGKVALTNIGFFDYVAGLLAWMAGSWLVTGATGWIYNRLPAA